MNKKEIYVYPYFNGERVPDSLTLDYGEGITKVKTLVNVDKAFHEWLAKVGTEGKLEFRTGNPSITLKTIDNVRMDFTKIKSDVDELPEVEITFTEIE